MTTCMAAAATDQPARPLDVLAAVRELLDLHEHVALATVVETWGSSPVPVGGRMVIAGDDTFQGSVSGGCVEGEVIVAAAEVVGDGRPRLLTFGVSNETAWQAGLPCGGNVSVLLVRLSRHDGFALLDRVIAATARREVVALATDTTSGAMRAHTPADAPPHVADCIARGKSAMATAGDGSLQFVQVAVPPPRVLVVGATHIAQHLVAMLRLVGYDAVVVDPRTAYATPERFAGTRLVTEWPDDALPALGLDAHTAVVAVAHVPDIDDAALRLALRAGCFYVGALGSTRNHARRRERLAAAGIGADEIARIRAPIGLDIGAEGPAEIAVSILAEIVARWRGRRCA